GKNHWYLRSSENACFSPNWDSVLIWVNQAPTPTSAQAPSVCTKSLGTMTVKVPYGQVWWYGDSLDTEPYEKGEILDLGLVLSNRKLWYQTESNGCYGPKIPLELIAKPRPAAGFTWTLLWQNKINCVPISTANLSFYWEWGDGTNKTGMPGVHQYDASGAYNVRLIVTSTLNGCKDTADIPVLIDHTGVESFSDLGMSLYPNPIQPGSWFTVEGSAFERLRWYDALGREVAQTEPQFMVKTLPGTSSYQVPANLPAGTYLIQANRGDRRASVRVQVLP
ncbi:MAG: PKD domain-containing protein, partial [Bacteroidia bacterium]